MHVRVRTHACSARTHVYIYTRLRTHVRAHTMNCISQKSRSFNNIRHANHAEPFEHVDCLYMYICTPYGAHIKLLINSRYISARNITRIYHSYKRISCKSNYCSGAREKAMAAIIQFSCLVLLLCFITGCYGCHGKRNNKTISS